MLFKEIIGHGAVKTRLVQSVKDGRISHAQLFLGPEGSGSLPLAVAYAQYISCKGVKQEDACGTCLSCIKYNKLVHPDLHFAYPVALSKEVRTSTHVLDKWREVFLSNPYFNLPVWFEQLEAENKQALIGTEESAEIIRKLSLTTYESEFKVMIIWLPEKMNAAAANKLLKILEEPPDKTLFLLVCESEDQLLRTIVSRTQLVKINKISDQDLAAHIMQKHGFTEEDARKLVHLADGSYTEALRIIHENEGGATHFAQFQKWMRMCLKFDAVKVLAWVDEVASAGRESQKNFLQYALHVVRECIILSYASQHLTRVQGEELEFLKKFASFVHGGNCEKFMDEINKAYAQIERNANPKVLFLDLSLKINELLNLPLRTNKA